MAVYGHIGHALTQKYEQKLTLYDINLTLNDTTRIGTGIDAI